MDARLFLSLAFLEDEPVTSDYPRGEIAVGLRPDGAIHPAGVPELAQERPRAMFPSIIHAGLVGDDFLRRFRVTYDVPGAQLLFA